MNPPSIFLKIPCLTEKSKTISSRELMSTWFSSGDKRYADRYIQKFLRLNHNLFNFLGIQPEIIGVERNACLYFRSSSYIGAIPLQSPINGKTLADFIVYPRYVSEGLSIDEYINLIYMLKGIIEPEYLDSFELLSKDQHRPPIYYECVKFIDFLFNALITNWVKFESNIFIKAFPKNQIDWKKYLSYEWDPSKRLDYPCRINTLHRLHDEMRYLKYVFNFSNEKIYDHETPASLKNKTIANINYIEKYLSSLQPLQTDKLIIHNSDPIIIRKTKEQGNVILSYERTHFKAWRIDFSTVFEKYIQYLFMELSKKFGWDIKQNIKFPVQSTYLPGWGLNYFEPDIILSKGIYSIAIDAKYKPHLFNIQSSSDYLKTEHRFDLHQITAYCAFQEGKQKIGFLCYPSTNLHWRKLKYSNNHSSTEVGIYLIGIPITSSNIKKIMVDLHKEFEKILINEKIISTTNS